MSKFKDFDLDVQIKTNNNISVNEYTTSLIFYCSGRCPTNIMLCPSRFNGCK